MAVRTWTWLATCRAARTQQNTSMLKSQNGFRRCMDAFIEGSRAFRRGPRAAIYFLFLSFPRHYMHLLIAPPSPLCIPACLPRLIFRLRLTKHLSLNRIDARALEQGVGGQEGGRAAEAKKTPKRKKKFKPTSYPASRPMHKEVRGGLVRGGCARGLSLS